MKIKTLLLTLLSVTVAFPTYAQTVLEEVVVTAQRREQSLQEVPVSVTAFTGAALERSNIRGATDYLSLTPNVSFTEDGQAGARGLGLAIRGVNNLVSGENAFTPSIGIYMDEFSISSVPNGVANPFLPDMQRVEVLRGPQGTYFGRNAVGGALNLSTNDPTEEFGAKLTVGGEKYESANEMFNLTGVVNLPVTESLGLRAVAYYEDSGGLVDNLCRTGASAAECPFAAVNNFTPNGAPDSGHEWLDLRIKAVWEPTESTTVKTTLVYSDQDQGADENVPSGVLDLDSIDTFGRTGSVDPGTGFYPDNRNKISHDLAERNQLETLIAIVNIAHDLGDDLTLKWISGIIDAEQKRLFDNDLLGGYDALQRTNDYDGKSWSTELRMELTRERYDFVLGALYARDDQEQQNNVAVSTQPTATTAAVDGVGVLPPFPEGLGLALNSKNFELKSAAVFSDLTWRWTERLETFIGLRYTHDKVLNEFRSFGNRPMPDDPACNNPGCPDFFPSYVNFDRGGSSGNPNFDDLSGRIGALYRLNDEFNLFATLSKGYKNGGTSVSDVRDDLTSGFDQEEVFNIEGGFKAELLDRRVRINASVFHLIWSDLQMEAFRLIVPGDLTSNFEQTINVNRAQATGFEVEFLAALTDGFTLSGGGGYMDSEIKKSRPVELTGRHVVDLVGLELPKAPKFTFNLAAEYRWPIAASEVWIRGEYIHRDGQYSDIEGLTNQQTAILASRPLVGEFPYRSPDYDVVNVRAGLDMAQWSVSVYIQNLFDEEYYTGTQENFGVSGIRLRPHPRVFGGSVSYSFGGI